MPSFAKAVFVSGSVLALSVWTMQGCGSSGSGSTATGGAGGADAGSGGGQVGSGGSAGRSSGGTAGKAGGAGGQGGAGASQQCQTFCVGNNGLVAQCSQADLTLSDGGIQAQVYPSEQACLTACGSLAGSVVTCRLGALTQILNGNAKSVNCPHAYGVAQCGG